jgi:hypothetical protein
MKIRQQSFVSAARLCMALLVSACGGGGVDFPEQTVEQKNQKAAQASVGTAAPVLSAIAQSFAQTGQLPGTNAQANLGSPNGFAQGAVRSLEVLHGAAVVVTFDRTTTSTDNARKPQPRAGSERIAKPEDGFPYQAPESKDNTNKLIWVAHEAAPGIIRWYCFGDYPSAETDTGGACKYPTGVGGNPPMGTSWGYIPPRPPKSGDPLVDELPPEEPAPGTEISGSVSVGCAATSPPTFVSIPLDGPGHMDCNDRDGDWHVLRRLPVLCVETEPTIRVGVTPAVFGLQLIGQVAGDKLCQQSFGQGWRMLVNSDQTYDGRVLAPLTGKFYTGTRFWVAIRDQLANAWCGLGTGYVCEYFPE